MTGNEYQELAMRTCNGEADITNTVLGLTGEAGECADIVKKAHFHGHELDKAHLEEELGDVLWYVAHGCTSLGITLDSIMEQNIAKLKSRYPEGFDSQRSINRPKEDPINNLEKAADSIDDYCRAVHSCKVCAIESICYSDKNIVDGSNLGDQIRNAVEVFKDGSEAR